MTRRREGFAAGHRPPHTERAVARVRARVSAAYLQFRIKRLKRWSSREETAQGEQVFEQVLVLNASFEPLNVVNWKRAMKLVCLRKVEVLRESDRVVRSARANARVPTVVRLVRFVNFHRWDVKFSRENIYARDKYCCQYCGERLRSQELTCDHVVPRSRGGSTEWTNLVTCCPACNRKKGGKTPQEAGLALLRNPGRPSWLVGFQARFAANDPPPHWRDYLFGLPFCQP